MAKEVWKYELDIVDDFDMVLPVGAEIIHVAEQNTVPCLWALVDTEAPRETRRFHLRRTGHPFTGGEATHVGSMLCRRGALVWHLFEDKG